MLEGSELFEGVYERSLSIREKTLGLIMSLWQVEDRASRDWMGRTHPFYWGGFVAAGDWR